MRRGGVQNGGKHGRKLLARTHKLHGFVLEVIASEFDERPAAQVELSVIALEGMGALPPVMHQPAEREQSQQPEEDLHRRGKSGFSNRRYVLQISSHPSPQTGA